MQLSTRVLLLPHSRGVALRQLLYSTSSNSEITVNKDKKKNSSGATDLQFCVDLVRKRDYDGYLCSLLLPSGVRESAIALRAFNVELGVLREQISRYSGTAEKFRLQFWKDTVETLYGASDKGPIARQPVAEALRQYVAPPNGLVSKQNVLNLIDARVETLDDKPFTSVDLLEDFYWKTEGSLLSAMLEAHNKPELLNEKVMQLCGHTAKAVGLSSHLRSVALLASQGVILIPLDLQQKYNLNSREILSGTNSDSLQSFAKDLSAVVSCHVKSARSLRTTLPVEVKYCLLGAAVAESFVRKLKRLSYNLFDSKCHVRSGWLPIRLGMLKLLGR